MQEINGYVRYLGEPNSIHYKARIYYKKVHVDVKNEYKDRLVRVYLPSTYDFSNPDNRYPVYHNVKEDPHNDFLNRWIPL